MAIALFASWDDLRTGVASRRFEMPVTMPACGEGTPSIDRASSKFVELGFHYRGGCERDREARGSTDWTTWHASQRLDLDKALINLGVDGHIGDRETVSFRGLDFMVLEGQVVLDEPGSARAYLLDGAPVQAVKLDMRTDAGSLAFGNPAIEAIVFRGKPTLLMSMYLPTESARGLEDGSLIYYRTIE